MSCKRSITLARRYSCSSINFKGLLILSTQKYASARIAMVNRIWNTVFIIFIILFLKRSTNLQKKINPLFFVALFTEKILKEHIFNRFQSYFTFEATPSQCAAMAKIAEFMAAGGPMPLFLLRNFAEIGRASCRERV